MEKINPLALLSLIIALSAYVGAVRLAVFGRFAIHSADNNWNLKCFLVWLIPADFALILSASMFFLEIFWTDLFGGTAPSELYPIGIWSFSFGVAWLMFHHIFSWYKTLSVWGKAFCRRYCHCSQKAGGTPDNAEAAPSSA